MEFGEPCQPSNVSSSISSPLRRLGGLITFANGYWTKSQHTTIQKEDDDHLQQMPDADLDKGIKDHSDHPNGVQEPNVANCTWADDRDVSKCQRCALPFAFYRRKATTKASHSK